LAYVKINFSDGVTPLNAVNMNHIEDGIVTLDKDVGAVSQRMTLLEGTVTTSMTNIFDRVNIMESSTTNKLDDMNDLIKNGLTTMNQDIADLQNTVATNTTNLSNRIDAVNTQVNSLSTIDGGTF
jgi:hypothetical protein